MTPDVPLDLPLKGGRTYVHSTDMYPAAIRAVADRWGPRELSDVRLVCRVLTGRELSLTRDAPAPEDRVAVFSFTAGGERQTLYFVAREGMVSRHVPYDEDAIASRGRVDLGGKSIEYAREDDASATLVEVVVALTKALHLAVYPEQAGKWVLTQIESAVALHELPWSQVGIFLVQGANPRLTKSDVAVDGERLGHVFFSLT